MSSKAPATFEGREEKTTTPLATVPAEEPKKEEIPSEVGPDTPTEVTAEVKPAEEPKAE